MCRAFRATSSAVLCDRAPRQPNQVRLRPPPAWWGPEDRKSVRRAVRGHADAADFQCVGNRQNAKILEGVDVAAALGAWEPSVAARAAALWESEVLGPAGRDAVVVSLYHRVAADSLAYRKCLPGPGFYAAARRAFEALYPGRRLAYVASSYQFKGAAAVADVLGADVVAIDDASPEVVMAALSKADARRRRSFLPATRATRRMRAGGDVLLGHLQLLDRLPHGRARLLRRGPPRRELARGDGLRRARADAEGGQRQRLRGRAPPRGLAPPCVRVRAAPPSSPRLPAARRPSASRAGKGARQLLGERRVGGGESGAVAQAAALSTEGSPRDGVDIGARGRRLLIAGRRRRARRRWGARPPRSRRRRRRRRPRR